MVSEPNKVSSTKSNNNCVFFLLIWLSRGYGAKIFSHNCVIVGLLLSIFVTLKILFKHKTLARSHIWTSDIARQKHCDGEYPPMRNFIVIVSLKQRDFIKRASYVPL